MSLATHHRSDLSSYDIFSVLTENNGTGVPIRYEPIFDQIKEARREDNETLSRGIWQTELKRADWAEVELLSTHALATQSKDLQVFGWLMESWLVMESFKGGIKGFQGLRTFCNTFWLKLYPELKEDTADMRIFMFDWMDKTLQERLLFLTITSSIDTANIPALTLSDWLEALNFEKIIKRSTESKSLIKEAEIKGKITLNRFRKGLAETSRKYMQSLYDDSIQFLFEIEAFCRDIEVLANQKVILFTGLQDQLKTISRIAETTLELQKSQQTILNDLVTEPIADISSVLIQSDESQNLSKTESKETSENEEHDVVSQRSDAYKAIYELGRFLKETDPHSPAPYLLDLISSWESKNLIQIMSDMKEGQSEAHNLLKLLAGSAQNR